MAYNIGPKIGIEGEKEFRQQIKNINNEYKTLQAQTKALTAEFDKNDDAQGKLRMQAQQLERQIDNQKRAVAEMEKALRQAEQTSDANSDAVVTWRGKLYNAQATVATLEKQLKDTNRALDDMENGVEDAGDAAQTAGEGFSSFGDILKGNLVADALLDGLREGVRLLGEFTKESMEAAAAVRAENAQFSQTFGQMEQTAAAALESVAQKNGISAERLKGSYSTVFAFAKTMGAESEEALDIASRAMNAAADSAAYYDKTVEEATETLQAYLKGNYANDAALGIASTETTRNAKANELYAKSFKELSEAQKVDVLLAMVEAGNKASGAMGQAAREADEWTNVTGEAREAWRQMQAVIGDKALAAAIPVMQKITEKLWDMADTPAWKQLRQQTDDFLGTMEKTRKEYEETESVTIATAAVAEKYVGRLQELEAAGLKTVEAQREYEETILKINTVLPELNLTINEQTGRLEQNTAAVMDSVRAWKQKAVAEAMYEKMTQQLKAYGNQVASVAKSERQLAQLSAQREVLKEQLDGILGLSGDYSIRVVTYAEDPKNVGTYIEQMGKRMKVTEDSATALLGPMLALDREMNGLRGEIEAGNEAIAAYEEEIDQATGLIEEYEKVNADAAESQKSATEQTEEAAEAVRSLADAYAEAKSNARQMLRDSIGLWEEMEEESEYTAEKIVENWRRQMEAFRSYEQNLKKARDMKLAPEIVAQLADGTQQSMQILDALVNQTELSVGEINAAFTDLGMMKDGAADMLGALEVEFQLTMEQLMEDAKTGGGGVATNIAKGISDFSWKIQRALADAVNLGSLTVGPANDGYGADVAAVVPVPAAAAMEGGNHPAMAAAGPTIEFNITQLPGESGEELANRVADILMYETEFKGAGLHG